jgi:hypothetical protein
MLVVSVAVLGTWALTERAECRLLIGQLREFHEPKGAASGSSTNALVEAPHPFSGASPDSYLNLRRHLEQDPGLWLASRESTGPIEIGAAPPEATILRASQYEALLNQ